MSFHYHVILMGIKNQLKISIVKSYLWRIRKLTAVYDSISFYSFLWDVGNFSKQEKISLKLTRSKINIEKTMYRREKFSHSIEMLPDLKPFVRLWLFVCFFLAY